MNIRCKAHAVTFFLLVCLAPGCHQQADRKQNEPGDAIQKEKTQPPLLLADPASEDQLRQAAYEGNEARVRELLDQGVNANAVDVEGHTALIFAAFNGYSKIILELLKNGARVDQRDAMGRTALMYGSTGPFPEAVKILLDKGADPNAADSDEHFTALMHAAAEGHLEVVKVLMEYGADPTLKDIDGDNAASFAQLNGHVQVLEYLNAVH